MVLIKMQILVSRVADPGSLFAGLVRLLLFDVGHTSGIWLFRKMGPVMLERRCWSVSLGGVTHLADFLRTFAK